MHFGINQDFNRLNFEHAYYMILFLLYYLFIDFLADSNKLIESHKKNDTYASFLDTHKGTTYQRFLKVLYRLSSKIINIC